MLSISNIRVLTELNWISLRRYEKKRTSLGCCFLFLIKKIYYLNFDERERVSHVLIYIYLSQLIENSIACQSIKYIFIHRWVWIINIKFLFISRLLYWLKPVIIKKEENETVEKFLKCLFLILSWSNHLGILFIFLILEITW